MSAPGGEEPSGGDQAQGQSAPSFQEISGGHHGQTYMGGQYGQYIQTQVNKTYNPVGEYRKALKEGEFQVGCIITVHENSPISLSSRIFNATLHSDVTGNKDVAVKITAAEKRNYREANVHFLVPHHKNIVERITTNTFNFRGQPSIFIAMERCDRNLHDYVEKEKKDRVLFDEQKYTWIAYQILVGLDFLHSHHVVHDNLKPTNVLLILNGNIVKLSDFGLSKPITAGKHSTFVTSPQAGTMGWQAPEVLKGAEKISLATDIFPVGLVLHYVWSHGKHPYGDKSYSLQHNIAEGINQDLSRLLISNPDDVKPLLKWMLENDPTKRPTAKQVLDHEIFASLESKPPKVTESKLYEIVNSAVWNKGSQHAAISKNQSDNDQQRMTPLGVTIEQLSGAIKSVFAKIDVSGPQPTRFDDNAKAAEVCDWALKFMNPRRAEAADLNEGSPLCRRDCDVIFMSSKPSDKQCLPQFTSQITSCNGKGEFIHCDEDSTPEMIQERLSNMPTCDEGINTVIVAYGPATVPLIHALEENNLRRFLQNKGLPGEDSNKKIQNMRRNLAVFAFLPWNDVSQDSAKIAVNIRLSKEKSDGKLQTSTLTNGKVVNRVALQGRWSSVLPLVKDFVDNEEVMTFIRMNLGSL